MPVINLLHLAGITEITRTLQRITRAGPGPLLFLLRTCPRELPGITCGMRAGSWPP
jgi:hypothetical protein